jgi:hypothetical protein
MTYNLRELSGWRCVLDLLCDAQWVRRRIGGKWERYYMPDGHSQGWHPITHFGGPEVRPSVSCRGTPTREEYPE